MIHRPGAVARPVLRPLPEAVHGLAAWQMSLNGRWQLAAGGESALVENADSLSWQECEVPCDLSLSGLPLAEGFGLRRNLDIPAAWEGFCLLLRFEAAQGLCAVYLNGREAARHAGGFLDWDCDITGLVRPGQSNELLVAFPGRDEVGTGWGGLVRDVHLVARPPQHLTRLHAECAFDAAYRDAELKVMLGFETAGRPLFCRLSLMDPRGEALPLSPDLLEIGADEANRELRFPITAPEQWDAEHPRLYTLTAALFDRDTRPLETVRRSIGFRQVDIRGNELLVNGVPVKLRGVCRHDYAPAAGHCVSREQILQDVLLFKEANCNYIRTSHYPPTRYFLELCDRYGLYVEDEIGFAFIGRTLKFSQKAPDFAARYLRYFAELIERDRSNPSVIIWSIANESFYGPNFALCNRYAKAECPGIPTKFSYPMTMQEEDEPVDIWSIHYANYDTDLGAKLDNVGVGGQQGRDRPVLHDEFAHIPCYNRDEHRLDPAVRAFYGQSIQTFWDRIWDTPGALGGAIWAGIDVAENKTGLRLLEWGIIDGWRRRKPEHFGVRQAYSPIRLVRHEQRPEGHLVAVENRFNHTRLDEVAITWQQDGKQGTLAAPPVPPRGQAELLIPADPGKPLRLGFTDPQGLCVEEFEFLPPAEHPAPVFSGAADIREEPDRLLVRGEGFQLAFSRADGLIVEGLVGGKTIITGGPSLNMAGLRLAPWALERLSWEQLPDRSAVTITGSHGGQLTVTFTLHIDRQGLMETTYTLDRMRLLLPWEMKIRVGVHTGGLNELGVFYTLSSAVDGISWEREAGAACWPADHIARRQGIARRAPEQPPQAYGQAPAQAWAQDSKSYFLYGRYDPGLRGTNDFRSSKHHIRRASALANGRPCLSALSQGQHSLRMELVPRPESLIPATDKRVRTFGDWREVLDAGNRFGRELFSAAPGAALEVDFSGTGIVWYAPVDTYYGSAAVFLDGKPVDSGISLKVDGIEFPGASMGFDKRYERPAYSASGLTPGRHTLRVEVLQGPVCADYFRVLGEGPGDAVRMIVNNEYNYPKLAWGNRMRPAVRPREGESRSVLLQLETGATP